MMQIEKVFESVQIAIKDFKSNFPTLQELVNFEDHEKATIAAIKYYETKYSLIDKLKLETELKVHLATGKEIFDEGFDREENDRDKAENVLLGLLEMRWIETFLKEMGKKGEVKKEKITAAVIALFCTIINDSGVKPKQVNERVIDFCKRICQEYDLPYTDNVRQGFDRSENKRNIKLIQTQILPKVDTYTQEAINTFLIKKLPTKEKLYN